MQTGLLPRWNLLPLITFEQVKAVAQTVKVGGLDRLNELLGLVREVGGLKKFKDLLEAMSAA